MEDGIARYVDPSRKVATPLLQTDMDELSAEEVALKYKQLWMVEEMFRTAKTLLETGPIYHNCGQTTWCHPRIATS